MRIAARMEVIGTETAFEAVARARALKATGRSVLHLEIGEPDRPGRGAALRRPVLTRCLAGHGSSSLVRYLVMPHVGSATEATRGKMAAMAAANLLAGVRGERLPTPVNPEVFGRG